MIDSERHTHASSDDHGQFCYARAKEAPGLVAVVATLSKGYDLDYIWKHVDRGPAKDAASYYIQASESGGEPPGRWWGPGAKALGFEPGQRIEREPYDLLFGERQAPEGTQLGRRPDNGRKAADVYKLLLAAEPHATAERKRELRAEAVKKARQSPLFFDLTLSLSKSISIFHASLGENARLARQAGDHDGDRVLVRPGRRGRRHDLAGRARRVRLLPARSGLHPHRLPRHAGARPGDRPVARGRPGGGALAAAHLPRRRHAAARPLPDRPRRPDDYRREMAGPGLAGLQRAHRRGRRDRLPAPGRSPHRPVRPGMGRAGRRPRLRDQGHQRGDDARVLLPPRVDHGGSARPRGAVRAAVRPRAVPARARAPRAGVELQNAREERKRAGFRAAARGLGGQARAHARRPAGVGRAVRLARPERPRGPAHARRRRRGAHRAGAGPRGAEGGRARAAGEKRVDPRRCDQVPGPRPAPHRPGSGRGRRAAAGPGRPGAGLGVRAGGLPGSARAGGGAGQFAARGWAQRLPAARRYPVCHARAAGHGRAHGRASRRGRRAARDPRGSRARRSARTPRGSRTR